MKKVLVLVGILALAFTLIACGNAGVNNAVNTSDTDVASTETSNTEETTETTETTEVTEVETPVSDDEELAVGKRIPNFELTTLEGDTVSLHDYDGKIILLNFWTTW